MGGKIDHNKQHGIGSATDHTGSATEDNLLSADGNGLPKDSGKTTAEVAANTAARHAESHLVESHSDIDITGRKNKSRLSWDTSGGDWTMGNPEAEQMRETSIYTETIAIGDPLYLVGYDVSADKIRVGKADSSNSAKMPAIGIAVEAGVDTDQKEISTFGRLNNTNTTGLTINDPLYVASGGGMTTTKPVGANQVQKIAHVIKVDASGNIYVIGAGRSNDIPNIAENKLWVGDDTGVPQDTEIVSANEHLTVGYTGGATPNITLTSIATLCYFPTGIEFGSTTQEYDVTGLTWVSAVAGGALGGIPDEGSAGHELAECLSAVSSALDATYLNVREKTGAASATNPLTVQFLFSAITAFDTLDVRLKYNGSSSHNIDIQIWNFTTSAWVTFTSFTTHAEYEIFSLRILGSDNLIGTGGDAGVVKVQFLHTTSGVSSHTIEYDFVTICDGGGGGGSASQDVYNSFTGDTGSTSANSPSDTLAIEGGTGITTTVTEDTVTIAGVDASATVKGISELATVAELETGTDAVRTITPDVLAGSNFGERIIEILAVAPTADVATGDGIAHFTIPSSMAGMDIVRAQATVVTAGTTGATTVQIHNVTDTQDMLSGNISIASAANVGTVGTVNTLYDDVTTDDRLRIDVDAVSTTAPKGLVVILEFRLP